MYYYDQPTRFGPDVEDDLIAGVHRIVPRSFDAAERFASSIVKLEARDKSAGVPRDPILFLGSSTIVLWKLDKWFSDLPVVNHGFGGSMISDSIYFFDRVVKPVKPKQIVFFTGSNDLAAGKSVDQVYRDFVTFANLVRHHLPEAKLSYIAVTPSVKRWPQIDRQRELNARIEQEIARRKSPLIEFVKVEERFLDAAGQPQPKLYRDDMLHLNEDGYAILVEIVRPRLK